VTEPVNRSATEPVYQSVTEAVYRSVAEAVYRCVAEPVYQSVTEPCSLSIVTKPVADAAQGVGAERPPPTPSAKNVAPPGRKFQLEYTNHCHRDPVNIICKNMRNSLFGLLILFEGFDELQ